MVRISGVISFRNPIKNGYPFLEAILSVLPLVDEYLINDGGSTDGTMDYLKRLQETFPDKIILYNIPDFKSRRWDCVSVQYNKLIEDSQGGWIYMGNADELIHEDELFLLEEIIDFTSADVLRLDRREVCGRWSKLSRTYWPARAARKVEGLHMRWPAYGGDEFLDSEGWIRYPPRCKKTPIMSWHLYVVFPGNAKEKWEHDATWIATEDEFRRKIYERVKTPRTGSLPPPKNVIPNLPALALGLTEMYKYEIREELFDPKWLEKRTGLKYR